VDKDPKIPEDDWKKKWKPGTYDYLDPEYKPGTHELELPPVGFARCSGVSASGISQHDSRIISPLCSDGR
jgi:hypothetical protein